MKLGDNRACSVSGIGTVNIKFEDGNNISLKHVRHVPQIKRNLISMAMLDRDGFNVKIKNGVLRVLRGSLVVMQGRIKNGIYILQWTIEKDQTNITTDNEDLTMKWHRRLGHVSYGGLKVLDQNGVLGKVEISPIRLCEQCVLGKITKAKFGKGKHITKSVIEYLHSDLWGPSRTLSRGGARYFLTFIDDFSRYVWIYILKK